MLFFVLYSLALIGFAAYDAKSGNSVDSFYLNGRSSGTIHTGFSLIASCVGGSATMGMAGLAFEAGAPAFWWLGSGACGLILLTIFLARRVRESGAHTMPELVATWLGSRSRKLVSIIIVMAWLAILAAQFTAMGKLVQAISGMEAGTALASGAIVVTLYSCLGGQCSVIRSDLHQCLLLAAGLFLVFVWLIFQIPDPFANFTLEMYNERFGAERLTYFMIILGGSYLVCPMLFGRILSARDNRSAIAGCWLAVAGLFSLAILIVAIGYLCRQVVMPGTGADEALVSLVELMPPWAGMILLLALLGAILSSADSCVVTAATVLCNDILKVRKVAICRLAVLLLGLSAYFLAIRGHGILELLLMANDIYVYGVVAPVFTAMMLNGRQSPYFPELALVAGGLGGLASSVTQNPGFGYLGMAVATLLILLGYRANDSIVSAGAHE